MPCLGNNINYIVNNGNKLNVNYYTKYIFKGNIVGVWEGGFK